MSGRTVPERYVILCLRVGAHVEGFVDAYFGPAALKEDALADGPHDPHSLRDEALALLEDAPREGLEDDRVEWLLGQLRGIECVTARLTGEDIAWADEVERCFRIRPAHVDEDHFRDSHRRLDEALPGSGDIRARYNAWLDSSKVPRESILRGIETLTADLRRRTTAIVELPPGERVDWVTISGPVWEAFNDYRGDLRSVVQVNEGFPISLIALFAIVAHEAYPGHHTERACKEKVLYRDRSRLETSVTISAAPEVLITEGLATNALEVALGNDGFGPLMGLVGDLGVQVDPAVAAVVHLEELRLYPAAANVARMLHEDGISRSEAESYVQEWALESPERAAKTVAFVMDPELRTYVTAYTDGRRLCRSFIDRSPEGFRRLLTEQLTVSSLLDTGA